VSVICKNTFFNYTRRDQFSESIEGEGGPTLTAERRQSVAEVGFVREALDEAIDRLPQYLQKPARLYFLEDPTLRAGRDRICVKTRKSNRP
jgi:hypothetical protein